ncbi:hypothetical protein [Rickettsiella massiliensis]|nr:hypothetical protein [Rickettsiella massiliensis]
MNLAFSARKNESFKERVIKEKQRKAFLLIKKVTAALLKISPDIGVKEY